MSGRVPNPGSDAARKLGCKCPVMDNHRGAGRGIDATTEMPYFVIREDCPLHGPKPEPRS